MKGIFALLAVATIATTPAIAQKMGKGGIGIDETTEVPRCDRSLGTVALVEERSAASPTDGIPAGMAALIRMAEAQNGGSQRVDPLPLLKLLVAQSGCFQIVDRGEGFDALQRERQLAAGGSVAGANNQATLKAADYLLQAKVLYSDNDSGGSGGGLGSMFPGGLGFKQKVKASQTMLTLVEVKTGIQQAVATGSARKKDLSILGGGLLTNSGIGALGGSYTSTDMGKITSLAMLDALKKLMTQAQGRLAPAAPAPAPTPTAPGTAVPAAAPAGVPQR
ncbi:CsgG/HfaB family protein [Sphingomonas parapaucimobilis]|uniref:CsgG/HfaB family protein n=1 Tax=Sphingomonas parapaucimobilis TaxID=28213 RepID=UPI0039EA3C91